MSSQQTEIAEPISENFSDTVNVSDDIVGGIGFFSQIRVMWIIRAMRIFIPLFTPYHRKR